MLRGDPASPGPARGAAEADTLDGRLSRSRGEDLVEALRNPCAASGAVVHAVAAFFMVR